MTIKSVANKKGVSLMALENKLGITDSTELAKAEERISKTRALEMFHVLYSRKVFRRLEPLV